MHYYSKHFFSLSSTERLLRLDREERRKEYRRQDYVSLDKIPTWRDENSINDNEEEDAQVTSGGGLSNKVSLYKGDITLLEVDAIVNAANSSLLGGGGVDGCIHKAAGSCLFDECHSLNGCETGKAKITCGYDLPARYVIHTVGPVARGHVGPSETSDLTACYQNSLRLILLLLTLFSVCVSGFPNEPAADIALNTVKTWIEQNPDKITRVIFCVFLETDFNIYKKKMAVVFQGKFMVIYDVYALCLSLSKSFTFKWKLVLFIEYHLNRNAQSLSCKKPSIFPAQNSRGLSACELAP
uniref:Macro domain-containing protein n=1 Tax=Periophthalmus magnuspinnatus TaxID=409849 RepID=A0A3B3ZF51_9GOBI